MLSRFSRSRVHLTSPSPLPPLASRPTINLPFNAVPVIIDLIVRNPRLNFCSLLKFNGPRARAFPLVLIEPSNERSVCATNHSQSFAFRFDVNLIEFSTRPCDLPNACDNAPVVRDNFANRRAFDETSNRQVNEVISACRERKNVSAD